MLEAKITKELIHVEVKGTLVTLCTDLTQLIKTIMKNLDDCDAHTFKRLLTKGVLDGIVFGTSMDDMRNIVKELEEMRAKASPELIRSIDILNSLRKILEECCDDKDE